MPRSLVGRDQSSDGRPHDIVDRAGYFVADFPGQRAAELLSLVGMHENPRLLKENRTAQPGSQDEMAFQYGARVAENLQHFLSVHQKTCLAHPGTLTIHAARVADTGI